jgi:superoxide reductase
MTKLNEIYKCNVCGNIVEMVHESVGALVCCGQPMQLMEEKSNDIGNEKHVPIIEKTAKGIKVKVGSMPHPMEDKHFIEWIEILTEKNTYRKHLSPGKLPEMELCTSEKVLIARAYCSVHGLWKSK